MEEQIPGKILGFACMLVMLPEYPSVFFDICFKVFDQRHKF